MRDRNIYKLLIVLSVVGIFLASFLFYNYLAKPKVEICTISDRVNCDAVTKGELATFLGVPVSLVGLIGYVIIIISSVLKNRKIIFWMALFGTVFCFRLTYLELFVVKVICPVCLACQIDMLLLFFLAIYLKPKEVPTQIQV